MDKCILCGVLTSFVFEGSGKYHRKVMCPKCQSEKLNTTFTGCSKKERCKNIK